MARRTKKSMPLFAHLVTINLDGIVSMRQCSLGSGTREAIRYSQDIILVDKGRYTISLDWEAWS